MSGGVAVMAWVLFGLLYLAFYLLVRNKEVRAAWARRSEGDRSSWKLLVPLPARPWIAWATFWVFGLQAVLWFYNGALWLAVPSTTLCLIGLIQGILGKSPKSA